MLDVSIILNLYSIAFRVYMTLGDFQSLVSRTKVQYNLKVNHNISIKVQWMYISKHSKFLVIHFLVFIQCDFNYGILFNTSERAKYCKNLLVSITQLRNNIKKIKQKVQPTSIYIRHFCIFIWLLNTITNSNRRVQEFISTKYHTWTKPKN